MTLTLKDIQIGKQIKLYREINELRRNQPQAKPTLRHPCLRQQKEVAVQPG